MKNSFKINLMHLIAIITSVYVIYYVWWRATYSLNYSALFFSLLLLICEIQGLINFFLYTLMTWKTTPNEIVQPLTGVKVDVYIPTFNEDLEVLQATIVGCLKIRQEHTTYILDDGHREEVRQLAEQFGCAYLTRADNLHAKAGNINAALKVTSGEFIVVLDADMVPQPDILEKTLGYFRNPKAAIVQLPQEFYNLDSVEHVPKGSHWHEQKLFYQVIQPGKSNINAAFWCGSPSIVRRSALESIGGVATESITEDFLTSIKLNAKGWSIKYHNEVLAFGIAPQSLYAFNMQRLRWAQGAMKILKSRFNPLIVPGLSLKQRLSHFAAIFTYFDAYQKLLYFLIPVIFLMTNIMPVDMTFGYSFLIHWVIYYSLVMLSNKLFGRGYFRNIEVEKFNTLKMVAFIHASFSLFSRKKDTFHVTPKSVEKNIMSKERHELRIQLAILILITAAVVFAAANFVFRLFAYTSMISLGIAIFWSLFNCYILFITLHDVFKRRYLRKDYRFPVILEGQIVETSGRETMAAIDNISISGIGLIERKGIDIKDISHVNIYLPDGVLSLPGAVAYNKMTFDGKRQIGIKLEKLTVAETIRLNDYLFITRPRELYDKIHKPIDHARILTH